MRQSQTRLLPLSVGILIAALAVCIALTTADGAVENAAALQNSPALIQVFQTEREGKAPEENHLKLVPADAAGFAYIRLADIWTSDASAELRGIIAKAGPQALKIFEQKYLPAPSTVERLTVIYPNAESWSTPLFSGDPVAVSPLLLVSTSKPYARERLQKAFGPNAQAKKRGSRSYTRYEDTWSAVQFVDDHTFIVGSETALFWWLDRAQARAEGPLASALEIAWKKHSVVIGLNPSALPGEPFGPFVAKTMAQTISESIGSASTKPEKRRATPLWAGFAQPILKARCATLSLDLGAKWHARLALEFTDEEQSRSGAKAIDFGVKTARDAVAAAITDMEKNLCDGRRGLFSTFGQPAPEQSKGPKALIKESDQAMGDLFILAGIGIYRSLDEHLASLRPVQDGKSVRVEASLRVSPSAATLGLVGLSAITALGTNASNTFTTVSDTIGSTQPADPRDELVPVAKALDDYHRKHGRFPAAASYDAHDQPLLSWRVEILPFLGEGKLYQEFKRDEPWDSDHNRKLLKKLPKALRSLTYSDSAWKTPYQAFVGKGAAFEGTKGLSRDNGDFPDGAPSTLLVVKTADAFAVAWTKPADLAFAAERPVPEFRSSLDRNFLAVMADGSTRRVDRSVDDKTVRALITRNGGEPVPKGTLDGVQPKEDALLVPPGMRAVAVRIPADDGVVNVLVPGTRVDLIVTRKGTKKGKDLSELLVENTVVLAVDRTAQKDAPYVVTLALTPKDAQTVSAASETDVFGLAIRKYDGKNRD